MFDSSIPISPDPVSAVAAGLGSIANAVQAHIDALKAEAERKNALAIQANAEAQDAQDAHAAAVVDVQAALAGDANALERLRLAVSGGVS